MQQVDQWKIQRRKTNQQEGHYQCYKIVAHQHSEKTCIIAIPTKNTYIDLDMQETSPTIEEMGRNTWNIQQSSF